VSDQRYITVASAAPALSVTALRGPQPPTITDGYGGWTEVARPRRKALTEWDGLPTRKMDVQILLDGFSARRSIENDCTKLDRMGRPAADGLEPPVVRLTGAVPNTEVAWLVQSIDWDATPDSGVIYDRGGFRTRQLVTLHLMEYVPVTSVDKPSAAARARAGTSTGKVHIVRKGETLTSIAAQEYGDASRWTDIAAANGIRDPASIKPGQVVQIP
jgi:hypothetical protein